MVYTCANLRSHKGGLHDDKVEEIEITALSSAGASCIDNMPDSTTGSRGKPTIELLQQMLGEISAMRWHYDSLLQDL